MNVQEIIVGIVFLTCIIWVIRRISLCFKRIKEKNDPCQGCPCGCNTIKKSCPEEKK